MNRTAIICVLAVVPVACLYYWWITRELCFNAWLVCWAAVFPPIRKILHTDYFAEGNREEKRSKMDQLVAMGGRVLQSDMAEVHNVELLVEGGRIPLRINIPHTTGERSRHALKAVLLWMHGGGWVFGSVDAYDGLSKDFATATGMIVVSVGYRLAPEAKFPVPLGDCVAAVQWVKQNIWSFGGDRARVGLVGESSGANLAVATAMRMARPWVPFLPKKSDLCALVLASPPVSYEHAKRWADGDDGEWGSYKRYAKGYGLEASQMKGFWDLYLKREDQGRDPLASPLRASKGMLRGLPPVLLVGAEHEVLKDEILDFGRKMEEVGLEVEEFYSKACVHGLFAKGRGSCGKFSLERAASFLKERCT